MSIASNISIPISLCDNNRSLRFSVCITSVVHTFLFIFLEENMAKYCRYCNVPNPDENTHCCKCGEAFLNNAMTKGTEKADGSDQTVICPECGSKDIHFLTIQTQQHFDAGDACCGYCLCGPLGLLAGVKGESSTRIVRKCMYCNHEF